MHGVPRALPGGLNGPERGHLEREVVSGTWWVSVHHRRVREVPQDCPSELAPEGMSTEQGIWGSHCELRNQGAPWRPFSGDSCFELSLLRAIAGYDGRC